jgi:hypothetical protein
MGSRSCNLAARSVQSVCGGRQVGENYLKAERSWLLKAESHPYSLLGLLKIKNHPHHR